MSRLVSTNLRAFLAKWCAMCMGYGCVFAVVLGVLDVDCTKNDEKK